MTILVHAKADLVADIDRAFDVLSDRLGREPTASDMASHLGMVFAYYVGALASLHDEPATVVDENLAIARRSALSVVDESKTGRVLQ